jgi:CheY-like chemotaxis protein
MKKAVVGIFEDDAASRFIFERLFEPMGDKVEVRIFDTPQKGFETAAMVPFDIAYIEIHFWSSFGGLSILKRLREINPDIFVVAMTSLLQPGDLERIMDSGFNMCLEKPVVFSSAAFSFQ